MRKSYIVSIRGSLPVQILEKLFASFRGTFYKRRREILEKDEENSCKNQFSAPFPATFYGAENADLFKYSSTLLLVLLLFQNVEQNCFNSFSISDLNPNSVRVQIRDQNSVSQGVTRSKFL